MTHDASPAWTDGDLALFGDAEEIQISTRRADGTLRLFVPIWVVAVDGGLFVRSYRGTGGTWYRHATERRVGAIRAGGHQTDVVFAAAGDDVCDAVDEAYQTKYGRYGDTYLRPMLAGPAAEATLRIDPAH